MDGYSLLLQFEAVLTVNTFNFELKVKEECDRLQNCKIRYVEVSKSIEFGRKQHCCE